MRLVCTKQHFDIIGQMLNNQYISITVIKKEANADDIQILFNLNVITQKEI